MWMSGRTLLDAAHHVDEVRPGQVGVQAAHDVDLAHRLRQRRHVREDLVEAHRVGARLVLLGREGAEVAGGHADVRVVDVRVPHEVGGVAVALLAHVVGEAPEAEEVVACGRARRRPRSRAACPCSTLSRMGSRAASWTVTSASDVAMVSSRPWAADLLGYQRRLCAVTRPCGAAGGRAECAGHGRARLPRPARVPRPAARATATSRVVDAPGRRAPRGRRDPPPGDRGRRARAALHERDGRRLPAGHQPVRHARGAPSWRSARGRCALVRRAGRAGRDAAAADRRQAVGRARRASATLLRVGLRTARAPGR